MERAAPTARRGPVQLRRIEDRVSRQVRFSKRRTGLFNKAAQLAVLCDAEIALLVFSPAGRFYKYSSTASIEATYARYQQFAKAEGNVNEGDQNRSNNQDNASSDLQSRLREITTWSLQNNAEKSDATELEKLEDTLRNALRDTISKKIQIEKQNSEGSTSAAQNLDGARNANRSKERSEQGTGCSCLHDAIGS